MLNNNITIHEKIVRYILNQDGTITGEINSTNKIKKINGRNKDEIRDKYRKQYKTREIVEYTIDESTSIFFCTKRVVEENNIPFENITYTFGSINTLYREIAESSGSTTSREQVKRKRQIERLTKEDEIKGEKELKIEIPPPSDGIFNWSEYELEPLLQESHY